MDKKDRNTKPGDNEIVTKKGFLISPPKKNANAKKNFVSAIQPEPAKAAGPVNSNTQSNAAAGNRQNDMPKQKRQNGNKKFGTKKHENEKNIDSAATVAVGKKISENTNNNQNSTQHTVSKKKNERFKDKKRAEKQPVPAAVTAKNNIYEQKKHSEQQKNLQSDTNPTQQHSKKIRRQTDRDSFSDAHEKGQKRQGSNTQPTSHGTKERNQKNSGKVNPSILCDLGFSANYFAKKSVNTDNHAEELTEKPDYSKAIPLYDQIYGHKKEKPVEAVTEASDKIEIIGVRFKEAGKIYYFDPDKTEIHYGTPVIVETARGLEYGYTAIANRFIPADSIVSPLKKIIRPATKDDTERLLANKQLEKSAREVFNEKVAKLGLEMSLVDVEYTFDNTKLLFYFAAETRIDFRELVKELASVFRTRIELRQVGVRDEAKMLGGLGICGRPLCCSTFLGEFAQVSIKMAKDQSLSLSSSKISGTCGRLLCCLRYEDEVYQQEYERTPKVNSIVETEEGRGTVVEANPLKGIVRVRLDSNRELPPQAFHRDSVKIIGYMNNNDSSSESNDPDLKELEEE